MESTMSVEEPLTYESVLQLIKTQTIEMCQQMEQRAVQREAERKEWEARFAAEQEADRKEREAKAERQYKQMCRQLGGIGKSMGAHAEHFFIRAMKKTQKFGGIQYDMMDSNRHVSRREIDDEFDIILYNGIATAVIEIKYKFTIADLHTLLDRKLKNFRLLCKESIGKTVYLGIAGFSFEAGVIEKAKALGIGILTKDGKSIEYDDAGLKAY
jgi:hypothetical protein